MNKENCTLNLVDEIILKSINDIEHEKLEFISAKQVRNFDYNMSVASFSCRSFRGCIPRETGARRQATLVAFSPHVLIVFCVMRPWRNQERRSRRTRK